MLRNDGLIALPVRLIIDYDDVVGVDCDQSAADVAIISVPFKCEVVRALLYVRETCAGSSTTPVVDFDSQSLANADSDRGAADIAHFVMGVTAAGTVLYDEAALGTVLEPGQEVIVQLATAATGTPAGHFMPELLVKQIPETVANMSDMTETA